jgi:YVTN family beta-propeller protein/VCBS repeat-containing protein
VEQPTTTVLPARTAEPSAATVPLAQVSSAAVSATTGSTSLWMPALKFASGVLTLFGANPQGPTAPANPLGSLLWGVFREIENRVGLAPPEAGIPTVGPPDPTSGVVTGTLNATEQANLPLIYSVSTAPALGTVNVSPTGTFTYTPSTLARQDASVGGPTSDSFTVTVTDGLAGTDESVTVPIKPLAGGKAASVIATIAVGNGPFPLAVSPNGNYAYVGNEGSDTVSVINTATNTVTTTIPVAEPPVALAFNPSGTLAYVANDSGITVIDTATNTVTTTIPNPNGPYSPTAVALSPNGAQAYVSYANGTVAVINTATDALTTTIAVGGNAQGVAVSPNGTRVYVVDNPGTIGGSGSVVVINTATNTITSTIPVGIAPVGVAISPDGDTAYVTNTGASDITNTVSVINTATDTVTNTIPIGAAGISEPIGVAVSPDGSLAYVANYGQNTVAVIDTATDTVTNTIPINGPSGPATNPYNGTNPYGLAVSPDGSYVYVTDSNSNTVSVISTGD